MLLKLLIFYLLIEPQLAYFSEIYLAQVRIYYDNHFQYDLRCRHLNVVIKKVMANPHGLEVFVQIVATHIPEIGNTRLDKFL